MTFYISDLHLGDKRVFELCNRTYNFDDFNKIIINNWNSIIKGNDQVYLIGDIAEDDYSYCIEIIKHLNGVKHLIVGNHDLKQCDIYKNSGLFESIGYWKLIEDNSRKVFLCHYPVMDWMEFNRDGYHVYGHIHNKNLIEIKNYFKNKTAYNASCDVIDFKPRTLDELIKLKEQNKDEPYIN